MLSRSSHHRFRKWLLATVGSIPLLGFIFYGLFHIGLKIPLPKLMTPFIAQAVLLVSFVPIMYWTWEDRVVARRDFLPLFLTFAGYNLAGLLLYVYYGIEIGVLDARKSIGYYVLVLVVGPGGPTESVWELGLAGWKSKGIMIRSRILVFRSSPSRRSGSLLNEPS